MEILEVFCFLKSALCIVMHVVALSVFTHTVELFPHPIYFNATCLPFIKATSANPKYDKSIEYLFLIVMPADVNTKLVSLSSLYIICVPHI